MRTCYFEKTVVAMKPTLLLAMLSMVSTFPAASAATELEALRARCLEQERQIQILQDRLEKLQPPAKTTPKAPVAPATPDVASAPAATAIYIVQPGDFLERIARKTHFPAAAIAKANGLKPSAMLHPGQKLKLPRKPAATPQKPSAKPTTSALAGKTHKIQEGETYSSIARKYGVSAQSLITANPDAKATALRPGQVIRLAPDAAPPKTPAKAPAPVPAVTPAPVPAPAPVPPPAAQKNPPVPNPAKPSSKPPETSDAPPASAAAEKAPSSGPEKKIRSVTIEREMTYAEFAAQHGTSISRLNDLNGLDLTNSTVLAKGSELYVPAQP